MTETETRRPDRRAALLTLVGTLAMMGLGAAAPACALRISTTPDPVALAVVDRETGQVLPTWRREGRLFVAGEPGARYGLRVTNRTGGRVMVVMSVDGVNVLTGETASHDQDGYVFSPYESYDVNGWRKSKTEVAAFTFAPLPQSYAARTGRPGDVGVIGIAVFTEKPAPPPAPSVSGEAQRKAFDASSRSDAFGSPPEPPPPPNAAPSPPAAAPPPPPAAIASRTQEPKADKLGTAHGAREWSAVTLTTFVRATLHPVSVRQIEYDTRANLIAIGVIPRPPAPPVHPRPFPATSGDAGYVPDPPAF